jgi:hypothetical protein
LGDSRELAHVFMTDFKIEETERIENADPTISHMDFEEKIYTFNELKFVVNN